jgi:hypothetical protein
VKEFLQSDLYKKNIDKVNQLMESRKEYISDIKDANSLELYAVAHNNKVYVQIHLDTEEGSLIL